MNYILIVIYLVCFLIALSCLKDLFISKNYIKNIIQTCKLLFELINYI